MAERTLNFGTTPPTGSKKNRITCTVKDTIYSLSLASGVVLAYDIRALNYEIHVHETSALTSEYTTIFAKEVFWNQMPVLLDKNSQLHFSSPTAGAIIEVEYWYH